MIALRPQPDKAPEPNQREADVRQYVGGVRQADQARSVGKVMVSERLYDRPMDQECAAKANDDGQRKTTKQVFHVGCSASNDAPSMPRNGEM